MKKFFYKFNAVGVFGSQDTKAVAADSLLEALDTLKSCEGPIEGPSCNWTFEQWQEHSLKSIDIFTNTEYKEKK